MYTVPLSVCTCRSLVYCFKVSLATLKLLQRTVVNSVAIVVQWMVGFYQNLSDDLLTRLLGPY